MQPTTSIPKPAFTPPPVPVSWQTDAINALRGIRTGFEGIGEDFRTEITAIVGSPSHPNAWGNLFRKAKAEGIIVATGEFKPMQTASSHGRKSPVYRKV